MILRPQFQDLKIIGYYLGRILIGLGFAMIIPMLVGLMNKEISPFFDFFLSSCFCFILGITLSEICFSSRELNWMQAMVVVSLAWLVAMLVGAIPLYLSGHWNSYLDACFEAMSGFATTGLILVQDLEHLSFTHNLWRHLMMFLGGQGIILVTVSFFVGASSAVMPMYVGEAREEKLLPNVRQTARFIWLVSMVYLGLGTGVLTFILICEGLHFKEALSEGLLLFMAAFDTGGFSPHTQNILYYHSLWVEITVMTLMLLGAINFSLHHTLWRGKRKEIFKNIEIRFFTFSLLLISFLALNGLSQKGLYQDKLSLFRRGFFQILSAHTGTGYTNLSSFQLHQWPQTAFLFLIIAMALGGSICSTTGGIKALRIGFFFKGLLYEIRTFMLPESSPPMGKIHHLKDIVLENKQLKMAYLIILLYLGAYLTGAIAGVLCGFSFPEALFESTSAAANVGLSVGITNPSMPALLKCIYIFQMWLGRLEFMAVFVLLGFIIALVKGR